MGSSGTLGISALAWKSGSRLSISYYTVVKDRRSTCLVSLIQLVLALVGALVFGYASIWVYVLALGVEMRHLDQGSFILCCSGPLGLVAGYTAANRLVRFLPGAKPQEEAERNPND